jgi:hypothetical protein
LEIDPSKQGDVRDKEKDKLGAAIGTEIPKGKFDDDDDWLVSCRLKIQAPQYFIVEKEESLRGMHASTSRESRLFVSPLRQGQWMQQAVIAVVTRKLQGYPYN